MPFGSEGLDRLIAKRRISRKLNRGSFGPDRMTCGGGGRDVHWHCQRHRGRLAQAQGRDASPSPAATSMTSLRRGRLDRLRRLLPHAVDVQQGQEGRDLRGRSLQRDAGAHHARRLAGGTPHQSRARADARRRARRPSRDRPCRGRRQDRSSARQTATACTIRVRGRPRNFARFIAPKGSIALDGISLTVNEVDGTRFGVNIIPHTLDAHRRGGTAARRSGKP